MKKVMISLSALALSLGLAACSNSNNAKTDKQETTQTASSNMNVKKELVKFYMDLGKTINEKDIDLNSYVNKASKPDTKPTAEDQVKASASAAAVADALNKFQVPADLKDQKADLVVVVKEFAASYQTKANELKKAAPNLNAANAAFAQADQKLGKIFENAKLLPPTLDKQVN
ncbi:hypothetical protein HPT25_13195 [Bacillus sp. BRMEA1]|uniref:hypothetical protein n=1 Tax=Neobacillus endophyticus TaxID=2738405 RepID=UPI00156649CE|nr:hypothetical protein [Neobacillus endophyticus]NRD78321.1 hypothetical protein [Neobacillus endophyticus]